MGRAMKDSGVEWIGEIPADWSCIRCKYLAKVQAGAPFKSELFSNTSGFPLIRIRDITSGKIETFYTGEYLDEYIVHAGDLLIGMDGNFNTRLWNGQDALLNQRCCKVISGKMVLTKWLAYYLPFGLLRINQLAYATTVKHLSNVDILELPIVFPSQIEQEKVLAFLDVICTKVDSAIEKTSTSIEEYKHLKQAVITRAVTKGVRGDRPMKESGIEWLKEIPSTWSTEKGKRLFVETNERSADGSEELLTVSHITGVTPRSQKNVNMFMAETLTGYKVCHVGDIAANTMWMWQGAIGVSMYHGVISPSYNTYRQSIGAYDSEYLDYLLRAKPLVGVYNAYSTGITISRLRLYPEQFFSIVFPVPPVDEQKEIAAYLDEKCTEIDALIAKKEQLLTELENYKKSLIYEYVTGKKTVSE